MVEYLYFILALVSILGGAFILIFLTHKAGDNLHRLNHTSVLFLLVALLATLMQWGEGVQGYLLEEILGKVIYIDEFALLFDTMFILGTIFTLLINTEYFSHRRYFNGEYFALLLFALFGMMVLAHSHELITAFIALEIASLSVYTLVGYHKNNLISSEAMMKYFTLGSVAGVFFLLGSALIFANVGSTNLSVIAAYTAHPTGDLTAIIVGATFIMIAILFKIGAVPFHAWVLDVYEGAPFPVTMFMASTFKIAIFAIALRLYLVDFASLHGIWTHLLELFAVLTLLGGSWLAITQNSLKRMLAGSSIVHSGYMLIALTSIGLGSKLAAPAIVFYLITYFVSAVGAFGILSYISATGKKELTYDDFKGFSERRPYMAAMMSIFMLSLAGFPSTIGFLGKFYIFTAAIESGELFLTGFGIAIAFVSTYYYFKLIAMIYFYPNKESQKEFIFSSSTLLMILMASVVILGGIGSSLIPYIPSPDGFLHIVDVVMSTLLPQGK